jgi:hypothetical protein
VGVLDGKLGLANPSKAVEGANLHGSAASFVCEASTEFLHKVVAAREMHPPWRRLKYGVVPTGEASAAGRIFVVRVLPAAGGLDAAKSHASQ